MNEHSTVDQNKSFRYIVRPTRRASLCLQIHVLDAGPEHSCFQFFKRFGRGMCSASRACFEQVNL